MSKKRVREAIDLRLGIPIESKEELSELAKEANRATDRMIRSLDKTIAHADRVLRQTKNDKPKVARTRPRSIRRKL